MPSCETDQYAALSFSMSRVRESHEGSQRFLRAHMDALKSDPRSCVVGFLSQGLLQCRSLRPDEPEFHSSHHARCFAAYWDDHSLSFHFLVVDSNGMSEAERDDLAKYVIESRILPEGPWMIDIHGFALQKELGLCQTYAILLAILFGAFVTDPRRPLDVPGNVAFHDIVDTWSLQEETERFQWLWSLWEIVWSGRASILTQAHDMQDLFNRSVVERMTVPWEFVKDDFLADPESRAEEATLDSPLADDVVTVGFVLATRKS